MPADWLCTVPIFSSRCGSADYFWVSVEFIEKGEPRYRYCFFSSVLDPDPDLCFDDQKWEYRIKVKKNFECSFTKLQCFFFLRLFHERFQALKESFSSTEISSSSSNEENFKFFSCLGHGCLPWTGSDPWSTLLAHTVQKIYSRYRYIR